MSDSQRGPFSDRHDDPQPKKLDVVATLREAYQGAWSNLSEMVRLIWLPGVLYLTLNVIGSMMPSESSMMLRFALEMASLFLWTIISVAWYRFILLGEAPVSSFQINFGKREGRYMLAFFLLLMLALPVLLTPTFANSPEASSSAGSLVAFFAMLLSLLSMYFLFRLLLLLPAISIDEPFNIRMVLERTRGNFWRIFSTCILSSLPFLVVLVAMIALGEALGLPTVISLIVSSLVSIFFAIVNVAVLAIFYRELIGPPGTMAADIDRLDTA